MQPLFAYNALIWKNTITILTLILFVVFLVRISYLFAVSGKHLLKSNQGFEYQQQARDIRSSFCRLSRRCGAFSRPGGLRPCIYWAAARGNRRPAENRALCACRWPLLRQRCWAHSASYPFGAPRWGSWRVPPASISGCVRCGDFACVWTRSLTRPVSRTIRLWTPFLASTTSCNTKWRYPFLHLMK